MAFSLDSQIRFRRFVFEARDTPGSMMIEFGEP
jgi:hypothetical protein